MTKPTNITEVEKGRRLGQITHGLSKTRFYKIWENIKTRVGNKKHRSYRHYGGRGIGICKEWYKFENFKKDMYEAYLKHAEKYGEKQTTIDRINNDGNYSKKNCRWATRQEQHNNTRANVFLTHNGMTMTIQQWNKQLGFKGRDTLHQRLGYGWSIERALTEPSRRRNQL